MKKIRKTFMFILTFVLLVSLQCMMVMAAGNTKTASSKASIFLKPGTIGSTNSVTFSFSSLPSTETVKSIKVSAPLSSHSGKAAIIVNSFTIISPEGTTVNIPVSSGNSATSYAFNGENSSTG